jgi:hypothetical protein
VPNRHDDDGVGFIGSLRGVVTPFLLSRLLVSAVVLAGLLGAHLRVQPWDMGWYCGIASGWYPAGDDLSGESPYPFFPVVPSLLMAGSLAGIPYDAFSIAAANAIFLLALIGVRWLVELRLGAKTATATVWALCVFPLSGIFCVLYPDVIVLACAAWGFLAIEKRRVLPAVLLGALATLSRPNGILLPLAFSLAAGNWRRVAAIFLPSAGLLAAWIWYVGQSTGDPLAFVTSKAAWHEITLQSVLLDRDMLSSPDLRLHLALAVPFLLAASLRMRALPISWRALAMMWVIPSLFLGMIGLARYALTAFPVSVAFADLLHSRRVVSRVVLVLSTGLLCIVTWLVAFGTGEEMFTP